MTHILLQLQIEITLSIMKYVKGVRYESDKRLDIKPIQYKKLYTFYIDK